MKKSLIILIVVVVSQNCIGQINAKKAVNLFEELPGIWQNQLSLEYESWLKKGIGYEGRMYHVKGEDTVVTEYCRIFKEKNKYYYEATVLDQNDAQPIRFQLTKADDKTLVFENKKHDFPQVITYQWEDANTIKASISGKLRDSYETYSFPFTRVSN